jgi:hypothetical protein
VRFASPERVRGRARERNEHCFSSVFKSTFRLAAGSTAVVTVAYGTHWANAAFIVLPAGQPSIALAVEATASARSPEGAPHAKRRAA